MQWLRLGVTHSKGKDRDKRSKEALNTVLESIPGIGEKSVIELLKHFKSSQRIAKANFDELTAVVGAKRAKQIIIHFQSAEWKKYGRLRLKPMLIAFLLIFLFRWAFLEKIYFWKFNGLPGKIGESSGEKIFISKDPFSAANSSHNFPVNLPMMKRGISRLGKWSSNINGIRFRGIEYSYVRLAARAKGSILQPKYWSGTAGKSCN